jgi:prepilin-type processing-associated H-X9-DG protein
VKNGGNKIGTTLLALALALALGFGLAGSLPARAADTSETKAMTLADAEKLVKTHLETFDDLDYNVFTNQKWTELHRSHSKDINVVWPDGHVAKGIEKHIEDLSAMFVYAPDTRIKVHTVKIGQGEWTAVIGIMEGTFTKPMPTGEGKVIEPTGKTYKINMATIGHWNKDGVMDQEYLFWDNQTYMRQLGIGK